MKAYHLKDTMNFETFKKATGLINLIMTLKNENGSKSQDVVVINNKTDQIICNVSARLAAMYRANKITDEVKEIILISAIVTITTSKPLDILLVHLPDDYFSGNKEWDEYLYKSKFKNPIKYIVDSEIISKTPQIGSYPIILLPRGLERAVNVLPEADIAYSGNGKIPLHRKLNDDLFISYVKEYRGECMSDVDSVIPSILNNIWKTNAISSTFPQRVDEPPQIGIAEKSLFYALMKRYPHYVRIDMKIFAYYPDITLNIENNYFVDIEVDEPYEYRSKKETHYIDCSDDYRNEAFVSENWFVLRFAEEQVVKNLNSCIGIISELVEFVKTGNVSHLSTLNNESQKITRKRWTKEEARVMAIENYRTKYLK